MKVIILIFTGVRGSYVTGPNGNCIFLPFAGCQVDVDLGDEGSIGYFWSDTYYEGYHGDSAKGLNCFGAYG